MIMLMYSSGKNAVAKKLETEYSFINFLANCRSFSVIEKNMNEYFSREFSSVKKMPEVSKLQDTNTQDTKKMLTDLRNEIE